MTYVATRGGRVVVLRTRLNGAPGEQVSQEAVTTPGGSTADGTLLVITPGESGREGWNIMTDSAGTLRPLVTTRFSEGWLAVSPDGRWLAYASDASRRNEVYLGPVDGSAARIQVSVDGGVEPVWSADGRELYYRRTNPSALELVAARLDLGAVPRVVAREALFGLADLEGAEPHANYTVAANGRFVMVRPERSEGPQWFLFYVMPYIDGESPRNRLTREKQLPIPDAVRVATEVASHRDIKPANILLHDGRQLGRDARPPDDLHRAGGGNRDDHGDRMADGCRRYGPVAPTAPRRRVRARQAPFQHMLPRPVR